MKKPVYIVISGKKKHGKNYFANMIKDILIHDDISFTETAFATPIKEFCENTLGIPMEDMETQEGKLKATHIRWSDVSEAISQKFGKGSWFDDPSYEGHYPVWVPSNDSITIRELLQIIGTDLFREQLYGPIWAEAPFRKKHKVKIHTHHHSQEVTPDVVLIPDCRFPNEVEEAKKHGAILVRVVRDDLEDDGDAHESEVALDDYEWGEDEVVHGTTGDPDHSLYLHAQDVVLPKIKGILYGQSNFLI